MDGTEHVHAAIVCFVHSDRMVNLAVFDSNGEFHPKTSVPLVQPEDEAKPSTPHATWMPYQVGQAAKTEELQKELLKPAEPDIIFGGPVEEVKE
jgi:hypothetical protein